MIPSSSRRTRRCAGPRVRLLALLACAPLLSAYVVPPSKVLQRWFRDGVRPAAALPALLPVRVQGVPGELFLPQNGNPVLGTGGEPWAGETGPLEVALRLLLAPDAAAAAAALAAADVDLERAGFARHPASADGVAHTLGARGEGEAQLSQVWFSRAPLAPCRVRRNDAQVEIGPPGAHGWPSWFRLADGTLVEVTGTPRAVAVRPAWASPADGTAVPTPLGDWRRAFPPPEQ